MGRARNRSADKKATRERTDLELRRYDLFMNALKYSGWTVRSLAGEIGFDKSTIYYIAWGDRRISLGPTLSYLIRGKDRPGFVCQDDVFDLLKIYALDD